MRVRDIRVKTITIIIKADREDMILTLLLR